VVFVWYYSLRGSDSYISTRYTGLKFSLRGLCCEVYVVAHDSFLLGNTAILAVSFQYFFYLLTSTVDAVQERAECSPEVFALSNLM